MLIGFLLGLACGLLSMAVVGVYYETKISNLKLKHKIWEE